MNLLYVAGQFPKTSESFVVNEVLTQLEEGHCVRVVSLRPPKLEAAPSNLPPGIVLTVPKLPVTRPFVPNPAELDVPEERWTRKTYATVTARWVAGVGLNGFDPDIIHAHFANLPTLVAGHLSVLLGIPYSFMAHATDYRQKMSDDLLRRRVLHADATFVVSHAARREIAARAGLSAAKTDALRVVRAAVRPQLEPASRTSAGDQGALRLVSIARHVPMKGLDVALHAFAQLRRAHPNAHYDLVGDGPQTKLLRSLATSLGVEDAVTFHGRLDNRAAQQLLAAGDIAVLPCRRDVDGAADGIPVFLMESGVFGIPAVTTAVSGIPELVVDGEGGLIVAVDHVESVAAALLQLANDAQLRRRLGDGLRARVLEEFDRWLQVRRLHAQWSELAGGPGHHDTDELVTSDATPGRPRLSVVVVARDEADVIERCVRGAAWADEVLVAVDSTTTDDTAQRARAAGAVVSVVLWRGFSATKNDAIKLAKHDWILSLDADEVVSRRLRRSIEEVFNKVPNSRDGFAVERRSDFLGTLLPNDTRAATRRSTVRLFHRAHSKWDEHMEVHEVVRVTGRTHSLTGIIVQWRDFDLDELLGRFNRYATVEARQMARQRRRARPVDVLLRPLLRFGWHYIARGEFRLGSQGVVHSGLKAAGEYMRWAKLWELQQPSHATRRDGLERAVRQY